MENKSLPNQTAMPRLAECVSSVLEEARRRNPSLACLDRLAEILLPKRMAHWPYVAGIWSVE